MIYCSRTTQSDWEFLSSTTRDISCPLSCTSSDAIIPLLASPSNPSDVSANSIHPAISSSSDPSLSSSSSDACTESRSRVPRWYRISCECQPRLGEREVRQILRLLRGHASLFVGAFIAENSRECWRPEHLNPSGFDSVTDGSRGIVCIRSAELIKMGWDPYIPDMCHAWQSCDKRGQSRLVQEEWVTRSCCVWELQVLLSWNAL